MCVFFSISLPAVLLYAQTPIQVICRVLKAQKQLELLFTSLQMTPLHKKSVLLRKALMNAPTRKDQNRYMRNAAKLLWQIRRLCGAHFENELLLFLQTGAFTSFEYATNVSSLQTFYASTDFYMHDFIKRLCMLSSIIVATEFNRKAEQHILYRPFFSIFILQSRLCWSIAMSECCDQTCFAINVCMGGGQMYLCFWIYFAKKKPCLSRKVLQASTVTPCRT